MAAVLAVCAVVFAGCGASTAPQPQLLRVGMTDYIDSLNPFTAYEDAAYAAEEVEYPALVQYGPGLRIVGDWASRWTVSGNRLVWTFHLKPGRWSDGTPLTAADAVWTGETALRYEGGPTALYASFLAGIKSFTAPNPSTLVVTYRTPTGDVLANLSQIWILPRHIWASQVGHKGQGSIRTTRRSICPWWRAGPSTSASIRRRARPPSGGIRTTTAGTRRSER